MIEYNKGFLGLPSLTHWYGSVLPRCAIPGLASAAMTMLVFFFNRDESWDQFDPAAFQSLNFVVGFMVIYRTQQAYARYWQGRVAFQKMSAYWGSAFIHICSFAKNAPHRAPMQSEHDMLLKALMQNQTAADQGRKEQEAQRLLEEKKQLAGRVLTRFKFGGTLERLKVRAWDTWLFAVKSVKATRHKVELLRANFGVNLQKKLFQQWKTLYEQAHAHRFFDDAMHLASLLHAAACLVLRCDFDLDNLITFDPKDVSCNPPYPGFIYNSKEGKQIRKKMQGNNCFDRFRLYDAGKHSRYCSAMKLGVIYGVSTEERDSLKRSHDPSHAVICWITSMVARRYKAETFVDPPITSRIFHELNQGHMCFMEALSVTSTPYPLPLAQITNFVVLFFAFVIVPMQTSATIESPYWAAALAFATSAMFYGISETARELEDPFVCQPNDIPVSYLHAQMNWFLIDLIKEPWPHRSMHDTSRHYKKVALIHSASHLDKKTIWQSMGNVNEAIDSDCEDSLDDPNTELQSPDSVMMATPEAPSRANYQRCLSLRLSVVTEDRKKHGSNSSLLQSGMCAVYQGIAEVFLVMFKERGRVEVVMLLDVGAVSGGSKPEALQWLCQLKARSLTACNNALALSASSDNIGRALIGARRMSSSVVPSPGARRLKDHRQEGEDGARMADEEEVASKAATSAAAASGGGADRAGNEERYAHGALAAAAVAESGVHDRLRDSEATQEVEIVAASTDGASAAAAVTEAGADDRLCDSEATQQVEIVAASTDGASAAAAVTEAGADDRLRDSQVTQEEDIVPASQEH